MDSVGMKSSAPESLRRELGFKDGLAIVVGTVIGSGIFLVPGPIAQQLHSFSTVLLVWIIGSLLSLAGSLSLAELATLYPGAGGLYVYLRHAFGKFPGFLYGWGLLVMIQTGSIATLASGFTLYFARLIPLSPLAHKAVPIVFILLLTTMNCLGLRLGKLIQNVSTVSKVAGLLFLLVLLLWRGHLHVLTASMQWSRPSFSGLLPFGVAMVAVLWAFEGWHVVSFTAAEFRSPARDIPKSLMWGTLACALIYILLNVGYYSVLTPHAISMTGQAAATAVHSIYGSGITALVSVLILTSILGAANGMILTGPRVYYAMAQDGIFFSGFSKVHPKFGVPLLAIVIQGIWASLLTLMGSFQQLFTYVIFTAWIFYGLTVVALIVLRIRRPSAKRAFRVPAYPWVPIAFVLAAIGIVISTMINDPFHSALGIAVILAGAPIYFIFQFRARSSDTAAQAPVSSSEPPE